MLRNECISMGLPNSMSFCVTKSDGELIRPSEPTPSGTLSLSQMDRTFGKGVFIKTLHVFRHGNGGDDAAEAIRQGLSKALVPYCPMAGQLVRAGASQVLQLDLTSKGVLLVEASADCSLEDVGWLETQPLVIPEELLVPRSFDSTGIIIMMQVTKFTCGGFAVCVVFDHTMTDGMGLGQFLNAVGDMARGLPAPKVKPVWGREAIPDPPKPPGSLPPLTPIEFQYFNMDMSLDLISRLKDKFTRETSQNCSRFDIVCAAIWQCRTRVIGIDPEDDTFFSFPANVRPLLENVLPPGGGYYGNCAHTLVLMAPSRKISEVPMNEVVNMIRDAKDRIPAEFDKWTKGEYMENPGRFSYQALILLDWTRLGFNEVDYGWGEPTYITPLPSSDVVPLCFLLNPPAPRTGVRLLTRCVSKEHLAAFQNEMAKLGE